VVAAGAAGAAVEVLVGEVVVGGVRSALAEGACHGELIAPLWVGLWGRVSFGY
jgi:hypothetical protein